MRRIIIIGCSGAGKSTLARALSERLGLPVVSLDQMWWKPGWENRTEGEFDALLAGELAGDRWVMDGNYNRTLPLRLARCDTVIWLDYPRRTCLWGVARRTAAYWGRSRPDMADGCPERADWAFFRFIWGFNRVYRAKTEALLDGCGKQVYRFRSRKMCARFLNGVEAE